jgi:hypothetical protein
MCVDSVAWMRDHDMVVFYARIEYDAYQDVVATFNWSNVVCVREEEDDDEGEPVDIPPVFSGALN